MVGCVRRLDTTSSGEDASLGGAVHDALDTLSVDHLVQVAVDEHAELADKLTVAGPHVVRNVDSDQEGVGCKLPYREGLEKVVVNPQDGKRLQRAKDLLGNVDQLVALQVELAEVDKVRELLTDQLLQLVSAEVKQLKVHQAKEGVIADVSDKAVIEVEVLHSAPAKKDLA